MTQWLPIFGGRAKSSVGFPTAIAEIARAANITAAINVRVIFTDLPCLGRIEAAKNHSYPGVTTLHLDSRHLEAARHSDSPVPPGHRTAPGADQRSREDAPLRHVL